MGPVASGGTGKDEIHGKGPARVHRATGGIGAGPDPHGHPAGGPQVRHYLHCRTAGRGRKVSRAVLYRRGGLVHAAGHQPDGDLRAAGAGAGHQRRGHGPGLRRAAGQAHPGGDRGGRAGEGGGAQGRRGGPVGAPHPVPQRARRRALHHRRRHDPQGPRYRRAERRALPPSGPRSPHPRGLHPGQPPRRLHLPAQLRARRAHGVRPGHRTLPHLHARGGVAAAGHRRRVRRGGRSCRSPSSW